MTRDEFRKEMTTIYPRYYELVDELRDYGMEKYATLNRLFCPSASYPYGVECIDCRVGDSFHCGVTWTRQGSYKTDYKTEKYLVMESDWWYYKENGYDMHSMTEKQMIAVVEFIKNYIAENEKKLTAYIEKGKNAMSIEDLQNECEKVANELLKDKTDKYGNKLRAELCVGRRQCDGNEDYTALCIESYGNGKWNYRGGIRFYKDKYGVNYITIFRPMCGESRGEFNLDWFKENVLSYTK